MANTTTNTTSRLDRREIEEMIGGDPKQVAAELEDYGKDIRILSCQWAMLLKKYPKRWIAIYKGKVQADAPGFDEILVSVDKLGIPRDGVVIRFVDKNVRRMIL